MLARTSVFAVGRAVVIGVVAKRLVRHPEPGRAQRHHDGEVLRRRSDGDSRDEITGDSLRERLRQVNTGDVVAGVGEKLAPFS